MPQKNAPEPEKERRAKDRRKSADRRGSADRRAGYDRRAGKERRATPGRRDGDEISEHRKVERRINEYPMTEEELEFIREVSEYKQRYNKPFPTWSEILHILKSMGYRKP